MGAPAEMPQRDEALKSLVARFKEGPAEAFTELAAALLVRGHASEALRVAEHGLQIVPDSVDGRIERAASLLALGRPRVAFVELKRALAIDPSNRRAMRLLGKVYVDAGTPGRAAELLKQRFRPDDDAEEPTTHVTKAPRPFDDAATGSGSGGSAQGPGTSPGPSDGGAQRAGLSMQGAAQPAGQASPHATQPLERERIPRQDTEPLQRRPDRPTSGVRAPAPREREAPIAPSEAQAALQSLAGTSAIAHSSTVGAIPDLFSDLTKDLGLEDSVPEAPRRVEVTQIIRRKKDRQPRSPSQLAGIDGPIVDTTQPGQLTETTGDLAEGLQFAGGVSPPAPLFSAPTSPRLPAQGALAPALAPVFGLDDEPLFQENMPFEVRPVEPGDRGSGGAEAADDPRDLHLDRPGRSDRSNGDRGSDRANDRAGVAADARETLDDEAPAELDAALRNALGELAPGDLAPGPFTSGTFAPGTLGARPEPKPEGGETRASGRRADSLRPTPAEPSAERTKAAGVFDGAVRPPAAPPSLPPMPPMAPSSLAPRPRLDLSDTLVEQLEESSSPLDPVTLATAPNLPGLDGGAGAVAGDESEEPKFEASRPLLEVSRPPRRLNAPKLELVVPKAAPRDLVLAAIGALLMVIGLVVFFSSTPPAWRRGSASSAPEKAAPASAEHRRAEAARQE